MFQFTLTELSFFYFGVFFIVTVAERNFQQTIAAAKTTEPRREYEKLAKTSVHFFFFFFVITLKYPNATNSITFYKIKSSIVSFIS